MVESEVKKLVKHEKMKWMSYNAVVNL